MGALPKTSHHVLKYALNWSIEGLINEYAEPCQVLIGGKVDSVPALSECEAVTLDGQVYEAFQTSGGLAYMAERYAGKINALNYKTLRYPGHCQRMRFLMQDLGLNADRPTLAKLLKRSLPKNTDDKVLLYVTVRSRVGEVLRERTHFQTFYPQTIGEQTWSAIQVTTAASLCAVVEQVLLQPEAYSGWIEHHCFDYLALMTGSFGRYLAPDQA